MPKIIPPDGPLDATIAIVGEAPGKGEVELGRPFAETITGYGQGSAGSLLTECLHEAGIPRTSVYLTNVVKERPPNNNITGFLDVSKKQVFESEAYQQYVQQLKEELNALPNLNVIVAAGATPLWALCSKRPEKDLFGRKKGGIMDQRGSVLESTLLPGKKVIPILHPAAALRQYVWRYFITKDLKRVRKHATTPLIPKDTREYILYPSFKECIDYLKLCYESSVVGADIEIHNRQLSFISFSHSPGSAIAIPFIGPNTVNENYFPPQQEAAILCAIAKVFERPHGKTVFHNVMFDAFFLLWAYGMKIRNPHCTQILESILYPDLHSFGDDKPDVGDISDINVDAVGKDKHKGLSKSLAVVTSLYTTMSYYKDENKGDMQYGVGPEMSLYSAKDSAVLTEAFPRMIKLITSQGNLAAYERQIRLVNPFLFSTYNGINVQNDAMKALDIKFTKEMEDLEKQLSEAVGYDLNPRSPKQLREYFHDLKGAPKYKKDGKATFGEVALQRYRRHSNPEISIPAEIILKCKKIGTLVSRYYRIRTSEDGRLRCHMRVDGTRFGRPSSSKDIFGNGANWLNQPQESKQFFIPDEGHIIYKVDLAQAENRIVAYIANDDGMILAFMTGIDIHSYVASTLFGGPADKSYQNSVFPPIGKGRLSARDLGKRSAHAFNYGESGAGLALRLGIKNNEGNALKDLYFERFSSVPIWQESIIKQLSINRTLTNLFGRKYKFYRRWGSDMHRAGFAYIPQSTIGEITNQAFCSVYEDQEQFEHVKVTMDEYDGMYFQVPLSQPWQEHSRILYGVKRLMEVPLRANGKDFHIPSDFTMLPFNFDAKRENWVCESCKNFEVTPGEPCPKCNGYVGHPYAYELDSLTPQTLEETYARAKDNLHISSSVQ